MPAQAAAEVMRARKLYIPWLIGGVMLALALMAITFWAWKQVLTSKARKALPTSASEVREYYQPSSMGDFTRLLTARMPESDFPVYAASLGLTERFDWAKHAGIQGMLNTGVTAKGWSPMPKIRKGSYFRHAKGDDYLLTLTYENGYVYYKEFKW